MKLLYNTPVARTCPKSSELQGLDSTSNKIEDPKTLGYIYIYIIYTFIVAAAGKYPKDSALRNSENLDINISGGSSFLNQIHGAQSDVGNREG